MQLSQRTTSACGFEWLIIQPVYTCTYRLDTMPEF